MSINKKKFVMVILKWISENWFKILIIIFLIYVVIFLGRVAHKFMPTGRGGGLRVR